MTIDTLSPPAPARTYVPQSLNPAEWAQLQPLYQRLVDRPVRSTAELLHLLADYSELCAAVSEYAARVRIDQTCHTDDKQIEARFLHYIQEIQPRIKPLDFALQKKVVESPYAAKLDAARFGVMLRNWRADVQLFRDANIPLQTQVQKLTSEYDKLIGAMTLEFRGQNLTMQQMARFLEEPDRPTREQAWAAMSERRLRDREAIEAIFDELLQVRQQIAHNADKPSYRDYIWQDMCRFDYTPEQCEQFADAIESACMPLVEALGRKRQEALGVESLRPWDLSVDPQNREPLRPFPADDVDALMSGTRRVFERIDPDLAKDFGRLRPGRNLDLASRPAKRAGGYQSSLEESREPFIFMNAAGLQRDVETLLHEGGHAFHFQWASAQEPMVFLRHAPLEFCEVASMSMELIAVDALDEFYADPALAARAKRMLLEGIVKFFPWMATIDGYQHWLYTHPGHTREQRATAWAEMQRRFASRLVDWTGHETEKASLWQRQLHLFHCPFYYIEYGIAQLGALQLWRRYRDDPRRALADYRAALSLGGKRELPALFDAAGVRFDFSRETFEPLMAAIWDELEGLPE
jgi:oligoendopeptidase F